MSPYGMAINRQMSEISSDINEHLFCSPLKASVIGVEKGQLTINVGQRHGVKVGDKFNVYHTRQIVDGNGITRQSLILNASTLVVQQTDHSHAVVGPAGKQLYGDININDMVMKL